MGREEAMALVGLIPAEIDNLFSENLNAYPARVNNSSELGDDCERFLVYRRTQSDKQDPMSLDGAYVVNEGRNHEKQVKIQLLECGFEVIEDQRRYEWPEFQITGRIDGKIAAHRKKLFKPAIPFDTKSMSPNIYNAINGIGDFKKYPWTKKYLAQLMMYLLMGNVEDGLFILKNRSTGRIKAVHIPLDFELAEELLQKAERINQHVKDGTLPDQIEYSDDKCGRCSFKHVCLPTESHKGIHLEDDPETLLMLDRLSELKPMVSEYNEIEKSIKSNYVQRFSDEINGEKFVVGGKWGIVGSHVKRKGYTVEDSAYWKTSIVPVEKMKV